MVKGGLVGVDAALTGDRDQGARQLDHGSWSSLGGGRHILLADRAVCGHRRLPSANAAGGGFSFGSASHDGQIPHGLRCLDAAAAGVDLPDVVDEPAGDLADERGTAVERLRRGQRRHGTTASSRTRTSPFAAHAAGWTWWSRSSRDPATYWTPRSPVGSFSTSLIISTFRSTNRPKPVLPRIGDQLAGARSVYWTRISTASASRAGDPRPGRHGRRTTAGPGTRSAAQRRFHARRKFTIKIIDESAGGRGNGPDGAGGTRRPTTGGRP